MQVTRTVCVLICGAALGTIIQLSLGPTITPAQVAPAASQARPILAQVAPAVPSSAPIRPSAPPTPGPAPITPAAPPLAGPAPVTPAVPSAPALPAPTAPTPAITPAAPAPGTPAVAAPVISGPSGTQITPVPAETTSTPTTPQNNPNATNTPPPPPSTLRRKQSLSVKTRSLALQEAIDLALQHNLDVQIQRFLPDIARFDLQGTYGAYDPNLFASGQHNYSLSPGGLDAENRPFQGAETESDSFNTGLSGLTPWGLNYSLTANATDAYGTRPGALLNERVPFENSTANASVAQLRQPLLKNFWIDAPRANIQIAKNRLKYSELGFRQQVMNTVAAVEQAYYNLIFARENVKVQETALQLAERLLWENKKKVEVGQLAPLDEKQAESDAAARRADLLSAQRALDAQENVLKSLITDNYATWHDVHIIPAESLLAVPALLNLQDSWNKGLSLRPDLLQARLDVQRDDINVRLNRNQLFPQLDLIGQYGYSGNGREFTDAIGQVRDQANPFWYYGASVSYPLGAHAARSNYKVAKATKAQNELILKQRQEQVLVQIDNAVKLVQSNFERVDATKKAREFAQAALDAEQKKLENGKSTSFLVLQFQRDLTAAAFAEVQALADYNNSLAQLSLNEGSVLDRHHLNLQVK